MTYRHSILILTLTAMSTDVAPLAAHVGDRLYPISYLSEETLAALDQDDASLEDWVEAVGEPALTPLDFDLSSGDKAHPTSYDEYDPSNLDFRIWLGWSRDGKIHVAAQFADDVYHNEYEPPGDTFIANDHISLMVDGDHSGGQIWFGSSKDEDGALKSNVQAQYYQAISRAAGGPLIDLFPTTIIGGERWMVHPPFARGGGGVLGENPTFWSVEFYVTCFDRLNHLSPEDSEVSQLTEGRIIGIDFSIDDHDDDSGLRALYYLNRPDDSERAPDASTFLDGVLLGLGGESGDSSVQSVSWGRIKASLEMDPSQGRSPARQEWAP